MRVFATMVAMLSAGAAWADMSCALRPALSDDASTLLIREHDGGKQAIMLLAGETTLFDCPRFSGGAALECYGTTKPPVSAPMQLNVAAHQVAAGEVVVVSTRNLFFGKNEHIGYHRRHASVHVFTIESCDNG